MRHLRLLGFLAVLAVIAGPAAAEEIIHFTSGDQMPVRAHEVREGMVHVDLGDDGFMAFPESVIEKIETAGDDVNLKPSSANNMVMAQGGASTRVTGRKSIDKKERTPIPNPTAEKSAADVVVDADTGVATYKPYRRQGTAAKRRLGVTGNMRVMQNQAPGSNGLAGTRRIGVHQVIPAQNRRGGRDTGKETRAVPLEAHSTTGRNKN